MQIVSCLEHEKQYIYDLKIHIYYTMLIVLDMYSLYSIHGYLCTNKQKKKKKYI